MESVIDNVIDQEYNTDLIVEDECNATVQPLMDKPGHSSSTEDYASLGLAHIRSGDVEDVSTVYLVGASVASDLPRVDSDSSCQGCLRDLTAVVGVQPGFSAVQDAASAPDRVEASHLRNIRFGGERDASASLLELERQPVLALGTSVMASAFSNDSFGQCLEGNLTSATQTDFIKPSINHKSPALDNTKCFSIKSVDSSLNKTGSFCIENSTMNLREKSFDNNNSSSNKGDSVRNITDNLPTNPIEGGKTLDFQFLQGREKVFQLVDDGFTDNSLPLSLNKVDCYAEIRMDVDDNKATLPNSEKVLRGGTDLSKNDGSNDSSDLADNHNNSNNNNNSAIVLEGKDHSDNGKKFNTNSNLEHDIILCKDHDQGNIGINNKNYNNYNNNNSNNNNINYNYNNNSSDYNNTKKNHNEPSTIKSDINKVAVTTSLQNIHGGVSGVDSPGLNKETFAQMAKRNAPNIGGTGFVTRTGTTADCAVLVDRVLNSNLDLYGKAVIQQLGEDTITFLGRYPKDDNKILIFLSSREMAKRLVQTGIQLKGQWVVVSHFSTPATKVFISNVMPFVEDSLIIEQFESFGYVVNNHLRRVRASTSAYSLRKVFSFRRELFIILKPDSHLPDKIEIMSEGETHVLEVSTKGQKCFRCGEWGHVVALCSQLRVKGDGPSCPPPILPPVDHGNSIQNLQMGSQTFLENQPQQQHVNRQRPAHLMHQQGKASIGKEKDKVLTNDRQGLDIGLHGVNHSPVRYSNKVHGVGSDSSVCQGEADGNWTKAQPRRARKQFSEGCSVSSKVETQSASDCISNIHGPSDGSDHPGNGMPLTVNGYPSYCGVLLRSRSADSFQGISSYRSKEGLLPVSTKSSNSDALPENKEKLAGYPIQGSDRLRRVDELWSELVSRDKVVEDTIKNIKVAMAVSAQECKNESFNVSEAENYKKGPLKSHVGLNRSDELLTGKMSNNKGCVRSGSFDSTGDVNNPEPSAFDSQTASRVTSEILEQTRGKTITARFPVYKRFLLKYPHLTAMINFTRLNDKVTYKTNTHAGRKIKDILDELKTILNSDDPADNSLEIKQKEGSSGGLSNSFKKKESNHITEMEVDPVKTIKRKAKELKSTARVQNSQPDFLKKKTKL